MTQSGAVFGTLFYMPPEQVAGDAAHADARADVYSLGVMIYQLISGELPFVGTQAVEIMAQILEKDPEPLGAKCPAAPRGISDVVAMAMAKNPEDRYSDAESLARDLAAVCADTETEASARVPTLRTPSRVLAPLTLIALLVALTAGAIAWTRSTAVGSVEVLRLTSELDADLLTLLRSRRRFLSDDDAAIRALRQRAEGLSADATAPETRDSVERMLARVRALDGLLAIATGDRERATHAASPLDPPPPALSALRGALLATDPAGDAEQALLALARAKNGGVDRPDLHTWRALALVRRGQRNASDGDAVLKELRALSRVRGALLPQERGYRAWALLAKGQPERAATEAEGLDPTLNPNLATAIAADRAELFLVQGKLERARQVLRPFPAGSFRARGTDLREAVERTLHQSMVQLRDAPPSVSSRRSGQASQHVFETNTVVLVGIAVLLKPEAPFSEELRDELLVEATSLKRSEGLFELALALSNAFVTNAKVQLEVCSLGWRGVTAKRINRLLPTARRGIRLIEEPDKRAKLQTLLFLGLSQAQASSPLSADELEEALAAASSVLEANVDDTMRTEIYVRRSALYLRLGDSEQALRDANAAAALSEGDPRIERQRLTVLVGKGRLDPGLAEDIVRFAIAAAGTAEAGPAFDWSWKLSTEVGDDASALAGLEALLARPDKPASRWWIRLAQLRRKAGKRAGARNALRRAKERADKKLDAKLDRIRALLAGDPPGGVKELDALVTSGK